MNVVKTNDNPINADIDTETIFLNVSNDISGPVGFCKGLLDLHWVKLVEFNHVACYFKCTAFVEKNTIMQT